MKRIYMDHAATTPVHPEVLKEMEPYFSDKFGNPSSLHSFGQEAKKAVEKAREQVADLIGAKPSEIVFTGSGTEANNFALYGVSAPGKHIITSAIEHHAILEPLEDLKKQGIDVTILPVDKDGLVDPQDLRKAITNKTILISIMHANNEIGTIEPIAEIAKVIQMRNAELGMRIYFHTDAVQTLGAIPVNVDELGVDLLSMSAHKLYGPKGVGALYIRQGTKIKPFIRGGSQENNRRASTENVPGIVGFGKACELAKKELPQRTEHLKKLQSKLIKGLLAISDTRLNGHPEKRLPKNINVSINYIEGESILLNLDLLGIAASTGSACSSGSLEPSHVLKAIGLNDLESRGSIRFSLGRLNTDKEVKYVLEVLPGIVEKLRKMSPVARRQ